MSQIPFCGSTYSGRSNNVDASRAVNLYPEITGTQDNKTQMAMVGTPGLLEFVIGTGGSTAPVRGMYTFGGVMYAVVDNKLISISNTGVASTKGTLSTSTGRVSFADNGIAGTGVAIGGNQLLIVDGANGYIWNVATTTFSTIASTAGWADLKSSGAPMQAAYIDGYFIVENGKLSLWVSNLYDGTTWAALATASAIATSDSIQAIINHRQQLFVIKQQTTEVFYDSATTTATGSPFVRVDGAVYDYGTVAPWSVAKGGQSFFFICTNRIATGGEVVGVAEVTDYAPQIISPPAISYRITNSTTLANCFGYCYAEHGHLFYVLTNPDDLWTLVYDVTTKMWHERSSGTAVGIVSRHFSNCYTYCYGKHFVGDYRNANLYEMSSVYVTDDGWPIHSFRTAQTLYDPTSRNTAFIASLIIDMETGVGQSAPTIYPVVTYPAGWSGSANVLIYANGTITAGAVAGGVVDPTAYLSWSDDAGHTWSAEYGVSLGQQDAFKTRLKWRRLGKARDRVFKIRISDAVKKVIVGAFVEAST